MEILEFNDQEDGSAKMVIDLTKEEQEFFIEVGINKVLQDYIDKSEITKVE